MDSHTTILSQALILILLGIGSFSAGADDVTRPADLSFEPVQETQIYKKTPQGKLTMHIFYPENWKASDKRSAIVFFFGGGWVGGSGNDCTLVSFADKKHGFFNYNRDPDNRSYNKTVAAPTSSSPGSAF